VNLLLSHEWMYAVPGIESGKSMALMATLVSNTNRKSVVIQHRLQTGRRQPTRGGVFADLV
jgi:hypothetical protein